MKAGRPTGYSKEFADEICDKISSCSDGLTVLCAKNPHWPTRETIYQWMKLHKYFSDIYAQAKRQQIEAIVDDILTIADDTSQDTLIKTNKDGEEYECANNEFINRSRLRVDTRKWIAAKLAPRLYGENVGVRELYEEIAELKKEMEARGVARDGNINSNEA